MKMNLVVNITAFEGLQCGLYSAFLCRREAAEHGLASAAPLTNEPFHPKKQKAVRRQHRIA